MRARTRRPFPKTVKRYCPLLCLLALPLAAGCYEDKAGSYRAVQSAEGYIEKPGSAANPPAPAAAPETDKQTEKERREATEKAIGLPFYPGARLHIGMDSLAKPGQEADGTIFVVLETDDPQEKAADFYRSRMSKSALVSKSQENGKPVVAFSESHGGDGSRSAEIREMDGYTQIILMNIPSTKSLKEVKTTDPREQILLEDEKRSEALLRSLPGAGTSPAPSSPDRTPPGGSLLPAPVQPPADSGASAPGDSSGARGLTLPPR